MPCYVSVSEVRLALCLWMTQLQIRRASDQQWLLIFAKPALLYWKCHGGDDDELWSGAFGIWMGLELLKQRNGTTVSLS